MNKNKFNNCLFCYNELDKKEVNYHSKCSRLLFSSVETPSLDIDVHDLEKLAATFLSKHNALTGVQKKLSLSFYPEQKTQHNRFTVVGALGGNYILKPPTDEFPEMTEIESLTMLMAQRCGIQVATCGLIPMKNEKLAFITKRFDRIKNIKIACEDLCQLSELLTEQKYNSTHERAGKIIRKFSSFPGDDISRYFELIVFSFLTGNADMHLKNFSLLTDKNRITRLAPAYDLLSTRLLISVKEDKEEMALSMNGKKSNLKRLDFDLLAYNLKVPEKSSAYIISKLLGEMQKMKELIERSFLSFKVKEEFKNILESRANRL